MATSASPIQIPQDGTADGELLRVENLKMYFPITQGIILQRQVGWVRAVKLAREDVCGGSALVTGDTATGCDVVDGMEGPAITSLAARSSPCSFR